MFTCGDAEIDRVKDSISNDAKENAVTESEMDENSPSVGKYIFDVMRSISSKKLENDKGGHQHQRSVERGEKFKT